MVLGQSPRARVWLAELPFASRSILSGSDTSAVITVGTATIGAAIDAGGYGEPILTGIRCSEISLILPGAVPAVVLVIAVQGAFDLAQRRLVSKGSWIAVGNGA
jgi:osmoprotectant transport system permease protein